MSKAVLKVLIVEDNMAISSNIADFFESRHVELDFAYDGKSAYQLAMQHMYDCIVLDIAMPRMDGLEVCRLLREHNDRHIPIIMLTARDTLDDKLKGFELGADDYLTKPFALEELYARVNALVLRHTSGRAKVIELGEGNNRVHLDLTSKQATRAGVDIRLQPIPFEILRLLMEAYPRAVTRTELFDKVWAGEPTHSDVLRSHLYQLRKAIDKPFSTPIIATLHGVGFRLEL